MKCLYVSGTSPECPLMGGVCLWEVSAYGRCLLAEVRLYENSYLVPRLEGIKQKKS